MPPAVIDAAQAAQRAGACVVGYLRGSWRALVVHGVVGLDVAQQLYRAGFTRAAARCFVWRTN